MRHHMHGRGLRRNADYTPQESRHLPPKEYVGTLGAIMAAAVALECLEDAEGGAYDKGVGVVVDQAGIFPTFIPVRATSAPNAHAEALMQISRGVDKGLYELSTDLIRMFPAHGGAASSGQVRARIERFCQERHAEVFAVIYRA